MDLGQDTCSRVRSALARQLSINVLLTTTQRRVLQYMRNTGVIWWVSLESYRKNIVLILSCDMEMLSTGLSMLKMQGCQLQFRNVLDAL